MRYSAYKKVQKILEALPAQVFATRRENPQLSLARTQKLLDALGNPEKLLKYIHVTGTSGKGSVVLYLHNILKAAGKKVGSYFSPHVVTTTERIMVNGQLVSVADFLWAFEKARPYLNQTKKFNKKFIPSHFETLFAMSLLIFKKHKIEWAVIEVGCGGKFDPTNVIPAPKIAVITNVGLDHQQLLGRTRARIARNKAGILKPGTKLFTGETSPRIQKIIFDQAKHLRIPRVYIPRPKANIAYQTGWMAWQHPRLSRIRQKMLGPHQQNNANLAIAVAEELKISRAAIKAGLQKTFLPARIEIRPDSPLVILDGAHNPDKIRALVETLKTLGYNQVNCLLGIGEKKAAKTILKTLRPVVARWLITQASLPYPKPLPAKNLGRIFRQTLPKEKFTVWPNCRRALQSLLRPPNHLPILITGSLYLAGELRQNWYSERLILSKCSNL